MRRGRTRTVSSRYPGVIERRDGSISASKNRMRLAQAEDSAFTVILPLFNVMPFTLSARSGPNAFITATCHSDVSGVDPARWARAGRRADIKSRTERGLAPGRTACLFRRGLLGIVSRLLGLLVLPVKNSHRERTTRMPASCKSLKHKEQDLRGPLGAFLPEFAR